MSTNSKKGSPISPVSPKREEEDPAALGPPTSTGSGDTGGQRKR
jgi:hypothetical protein